MSSRSTRTSRASDWSSLRRTLNDSGTPGSGIFSPLIIAIIKGENIPEPGVPESFKVLLKELQSLALDVRVLRDDNTEVKIMESVDYGETDLRHIIEGDRKYRDENESFGDHGFTEKEFVGEELEDVELDEEPDDSDLENLSFDDDYLGEE